MTRKQLAALRARMHSHTVVNDIAIVAITARELQELLDFCDETLNRVCPVSPSFIADLKTATAREERNDEEFYALLTHGIAEFGLTDKDIAHEFTVSLPTVVRWRTKENAPHYKMRPIVYEWLLRIAGVQ